jgi:hypothetical protein
MKMPKNVDLSKSINREKVIEPSIANNEKNIECPPLRFSRLQPGCHRPNSPWVELLNYSRPGRVRSVTCRLGTGKWQTFFYSVVSLSQSSCVSPVELTDERGWRGWGLSRIIRPQESRPCINHSVQSGVKYEDGGMEHGVFFIKIFSLSCLILYHMQRAWGVLRDTETKANASRQRKKNQCMALLHTVCYI